MKRSSKYLAMAVATVGVFFSSNSVMAQQRQGFDPEQMRQRMMERYQEALGVSSAEWSAIEPLVTSVMEKQRAAGGGGRGFAFGGRGGRGGPGGPGGQAGGQAGGGRGGRGGGGDARVTPAAAHGHERLSGAWNFRDVAQTTDIRPGRLFRSSELSKLDDLGRNALTEIGVTDVADLRSPAELTRRGAGAVPDTVEIHHLPFPEVSHSHPDSDADDAEAPHESAWQKMMMEYSEEEPAAAGQRWMTSEY